MKAWLASGLKEEKKDTHFYQPKFYGCPCFLGYVTGKGIECGARAVCNGVNLASRGILACINGVKAWSGNGQNVAGSAHPPEEVP